MDALRMRLLIAILCYNYAMNRHNKTWRDAVGFEGVYSVSCDGDIRRELSRTNTKVGKMLKSSINRHGYSFLNLYLNGCRRTFTVHKIVAAAFLGERPEDKVVNHKDGNKLNNHYMNLEYITVRDNIIHAHAMGLTNTACGDKHGSRTKPDRVAWGDRCGMSKIADKDIIKIFRLREQGLTTYQIGDMFGVHHQQISRILSGQSRVKSAKLHSNRARSEGVNI